MLSSVNFLANSNLASSNVSVDGSPSGVDAAGACNVDPNGLTSTDNNPVSKFQSILAQLPNMRSADTSSASNMLSDGAKSLFLSSDTLPSEGSALPDASSLQPIDESGLINAMQPSFELVSIDHTVELPENSGANFHDEDLDVEVVEDVDEDTAKALIALDQLSPTILPFMQTQIQVEATLDSTVLSRMQFSGEKISGEQLFNLGRLPASRIVTVFNDGLIQGNQSTSERLIIDKNAHDVFDGLPIGKDDIFSGNVRFDVVLTEVNAAKQDGSDYAATNHAETLMGATTPESRHSKQLLPPVMVQLSTPIYKPEWVDQFHGRIRWLVDQQVSSAQVIIDPPELGPMQVDIARAADNSTQITFTVNNLAIKELLDANMSRFKSGLASGENQSVQVDVRQQHQQQQEQARTPLLELERRWPAVEQPLTGFESHFVGRPQGLLDHYV